MRTGVVFAVLAASSGPSYAQAPGGIALGQAREAWTNADFDLAPGLYQKALEAGGLARADVVESYARIGAALAIAGKKKAATRAFRTAALVDPTFRVPPEAGMIAIALADAARKAQAQVGALSIAIQVPDRVDIGSVIGVDVTVTPSQQTAVKTTGLATQDALSARIDEQSAPGAQAHFDVPSKMTLPDATLVLKVRAWDDHANELATAEKRVHVAPAGVMAAARTAGRSTAAGNKKDDGKAGGGFWSSPWPYVIGGAALAAAGGTTVWVLTRPTDNVDVGTVRVQLVH